MRRGLPLLLSLLLVCAQGAGVWHGIGHSTAPHSASAPAPVLAAGATHAVDKAQRPSAHSPADSGEGRCDKCFQFAHFSSGAAPRVALLAADEAAHARVPGAAAALVARDAPPTRSRGPPFSL